MSAANATASNKDHMDASEPENTVNPMLSSTPSGGAMRPIVASLLLGLASTAHAGRALHPLDPNGDADRDGLTNATELAIGTDIHHMHPGADGAALGATSLRDFETAAGLVATLEGGVYYNVGSAVLLPEVFLKAVTAARNLGHDLTDFATANLDFIQSYRPSTNVVQRPTAGVKVLLAQSARKYRSRCVFVAIVRAPARPGSDQLAEVTQLARVDQRQTPFDRQIAEAVGDTVDLEHRRAGLELQQAGVLGVLEGAGAKRFAGAAHGPAVTPLIEVVEGVRQLALMGVAGEATLRTHGLERLVVTEVAVGGQVQRRLDVVVQGVAAQMPSRVGPRSQTRLARPSRDSPTSSSATDWLLVATCMCRPCSSWAAIRGVIGCRTISSLSPPTTPSVSRAAEASKTGRSSRWNFRSSMQSRSVQRGTSHSRSARCAPGRPSRPMKARARGRGRRGSPAGRRGAWGWA